MKIFIDRYRQKERDGWRERKRNNSNERERARQGKRAAEREREIKSVNYLHYFADKSVNLTLQKN